MLLVAPGNLFAQGQEPPTVAEWIDQNNVHRISGYLTLGLATATAAMGILAPEYHPYVAIPTAVAANATAILGSIAYRDRLARFWPHAALAGLGAAGMVANVVFLEGGSQAHVATGIASVSLIYGAFAAVILLQ
jgi:hypothetical protein